ncbi:PrgI family protein [Candidatus Saccharibacteria bacterium]|nr:PrgI family protein [Candidatus Saccharibacteria bacterium]
MATYKVLQDIEAEDKFLGPLTLKQFIFAAIAIVCCYLSVIFLTKGIWVLVFPMVPIIMVTGFLAFPWGRDQPTEVWLLAKIRFMFKPRKRIWDQAGIQELVKITAPPQKDPEYYSDNLSQNEVHDRLKALASTIDSRGWAVKGVGMSQASELIQQSSDRLVNASVLPQAIDADDPADVNDMFNNQRVGNIDSQITSSDNLHRQDIVDKMQNTQDTKLPSENFWFMNQSSNSMPGITNFSTSTKQNTPEQDFLPPSMRKQPTLDNEDAKILNTLKSNKIKHKQTLHNHKTIDPDRHNNFGYQSPSPVTVVTNPVTIELAGNNDRNIESLAREANKTQADDGEVVISLH